MLEAVASSAAIVIVLLLTVVSIPSPPVNSNTSEMRLTTSLEPESAPTVRFVEIVVKATAPDPFVMSACPFEPSAVGRVYAPLI